MTLSKETAIHLDSKLFQEYLSIPAGLDPLYSEEGELEAYLKGYAMSDGRWEISISQEKPFYDEFSDSTCDSLYAEFTATGKVAEITICGEVYHRFVAFTPEEFTPLVAEGFSHRLDFPVITGEITIEYGGVKITLE